MENKTIDCVMEKKKIVKVPKKKFIETLADRKLKELYKLAKALQDAQIIHNTPDHLLEQNEKRYGKIDREKIVDNLIIAEKALFCFVDENSWIEK
jgi:ABC-type proline/glycine betaine transport system ATPase subunit